MAPGVLHYHNYFLFPFVVDKEAVMDDHANIWRQREHWVDGLDAWMASTGDGIDVPLPLKLGRWQRDPYVRFDMDSSAYQDMVFFHPFVRRVFFDTRDATGAGDEALSLVRSYVIPLTGHHESGRKLMLEASDARGRGAAVEITSLRLWMFANGIGILSIGVEAFDLPFRQVLFINEMLRKVYPSSGRQLREGRTPDRMALVLSNPESSTVLAEERFARCAMRGFLPPLTRVITSLLYFADYEQQEYEPVLDERMMVYTYCALDPEGLPENYHLLPGYDMLMARLMYVDRWGDGFRYDTDFTREAMRHQVYRRWAHQGTLYGFTSYSNVTLCLGQSDRGEHQLREGFLIHRMFKTRYWFTVIIALFYRATLLDFSERTALVSRQLYRIRAFTTITQAETIQAQQLLAEFQHFSNYWYFSELANKDEEIEHFQYQCNSLRLEPVKREVEQEIEKLSQSLERFYQFRSAEAVNRLAMMSMILGGGAMVTGFFGMNFGRDFETVFFNPTGSTWAHKLAIAAVSLLTIGSLAFGIYMVVANWADYKIILLPARWRHRLQQSSLRRTPDWEQDQDPPA
jgi:hypothetical protein